MQLKLMPFVAVPIFPIFHGCRTEIRGCPYFPWAIGGQRPPAASRGGPQTCGRRCRSAGAIIRHRQHLLEVHGLDPVLFADGRFYPPSKFADFPTPQRAGFRSLN